MSIRGVRGATVASRDEPEAILSATRELLGALLQANPLITDRRAGQCIFYSYWRSDCCSSGEGGAPDGLVPGATDVCT